MTVVSGLANGNSVKEADLLQEIVFKKFRSKTRSVENIGCVCCCCNRPVE